MSLESLKAICTHGCPLKNHSKNYTSCVFKKKRTQDWCGSRVFSRASYGCFCLLVDGGGSKPIKFFLSFSVISFIMIFKAVLQLIHECCMVAQLME